MTESILDTLDAEVKSVNVVMGGPIILVFYTAEPWPPETGVAVVRALRDRYWNWRGIVVNLRPGEDVGVLEPEQAHGLYLALNAQFGPDSGHTCGSACPPAV